MTSILRTTKLRVAPPPPQPPVRPPGVPGIPLPPEPNKPMKIPPVHPMLAAYARNNDMRVEYLGGKWIATRKIPKTTTVQGIDSSGFLSAPITKIVGYTLVTVYMASETATTLTVVESFSLLPPKTIEYVFPRR